MRVARVRSSTPLLKSDRFRLRRSALVALALTVPLPTPGYWPEFSVIYLRVNLYSLLLATKNFSRIFQVVCATILGCFRSLVVTER